MRVITKAILDIEIMQWVSIESYDYEGAVDLACGPSSQQKQLAAQESSFASMLQSNYQQNFGAQSQTLQALNNIYQPIFSAGPSQTGWSPAESAAVTTQINEGVGQNYARATQALNTQLSSQGGGNEYLPSGAAASLRGSLASSAANTLSQESLGATEANYAQGRQNFQQAATGLQALSQDYNPNAIAGSATQATQGAFQDQSQVQQMKNQEESSIIGGITGLAGGLIGGITGGLGNLDTTGSSSGGEQFGNFMTGLGGGNS